MPAGAMPAPNFSGLPALLGGLYVIEGSRLGGALLKRGLPAGTSARFLNAPAEPGAWRRLIATGQFGVCGSGFCNGNTYPQLYDPAGRFIFAGATLNFKP